MNISVNGVDRECGEDTTLELLIETLLGTSRGSAAVVDGVVVPRSEWPDFRLADGQVVELIVAVQGG